MKKAKSNIEDTQEIDSLEDERITLTEIVKRIWHKKIFILAAIIIGTISTGFVVYKVLVPQYRSSVTFRIDIPRNTERQASLVSYRYEQLKAYCESFPDVLLESRNDNARMSWLSTSPETAKTMADAGLVRLKEYLRNEDNNPLTLHRKAIEGQMEVLRVSIDQLELETVNSSGKSRELDAMHAMYKAASEQLVSARIEEAGSGISLTVLAEPSVNYQPFKPKRELIVGASFVVSGILAVLIVLL